MLKAIIFDLGRVIIPFDFARGYRALESVCRLPADQIPSRIRATGLVPQFETGLIEPEVFVQRLAEALETQLTYDQFCGIWRSIFLDETFVPPEMIAGLRKRYRTVLLSNTNVIHFEGLRDTLPQLKHFDAFILSYEVKAMKPDPRIYASAVRAAGCRAEECFFTDDIPEYVEGAKNYGIDAVQFHSLAQIQAELRQRGVAWE